MSDGIMQNDDAEDRGQPKLLDQVRTQHGQLAITPKTAVVKPIETIQLHAAPGCSCSTSAFEHLPYCGRTERTAGSLLGEIRINSMVAMQSNIALENMVTKGYSGRRGR